MACRRQPEDGAVAYTGDASACEGLAPGFSHEAVKHTNKTAEGAHHRPSPMQLDCYVEELADKHNLRDDDAIIKIASVVVGSVGKRPMRRDLFADNGFDIGASAK